MKLNDTRKESKFIRAAIRTHFKVYDYVKI